MAEPKYNREDYLEATTSTPPSEHAQELTTHLSELRDRILISIVIFFLFVILCFFFSETLFELLERPAPYGTKFFQLKPGEIFFTTLKLVSFFAIVLSMPVWLWQIKAFLEPGLKEQERKILGPVVNFATPLFWSGMVFGYFLILPPLLDFLLGFGSKIVEPSYSLDYYLSLVISLLSICGISFQIPIILISLAQLGLVNSSSLIKPWRYVMVGAFVIAAIITPTPDPFTMSILAAALLGLYFITLLLMKLLNK